MTLDSHQNVSQRQQDATEQDGFTHAEKTVGDQPADQRQRIDQAGVGTKDVEAHLVGEQVILGEIQEQQVFHSVE